MQLFLEEKKLSTFVRKYASSLVRGRLGSCSNPVVPAKLTSVAPMLRLLPVVGICPLAFEAGVDVLPDWPFEDSDGESSSWHLSTLAIEWPPILQFIHYAINE